MGREDIAWVALVTLLLIGGLIIGQRFWHLPEDVQPTPVSEAREPFRQWFWEARSLDLIVQVGLAFAGALSVAALLPRGREDEDG